MLLEAPLKGNWNLKNKHAEKKNAYSWEEISSYREENFLQKKLLESQYINRGHLRGRGCTMALEWGTAKHINENFTLLICLLKYKHSFWGIEMKIIYIYEIW